MLSSKLYIYYHWALDFFNDKDNARKEELVIEYEGLASAIKSPFILSSQRFTAISHDFHLNDFKKVFMWRPNEGNNLRFIKRNKYDWKLALGSKKPISLRENFR